MMRSRSWLISAWKPKLSEAIFCVGVVRRGEMGRDGEEDRAGLRAGEDCRRFMYLPLKRIREPSISLYQTSQAPVPPVFLRSNPSRTFHPLPQHSTSISFPVLLSCTVQGTPAVPKVHTYCTLFTRRTVVSAIMESLFSANLPTLSVRSPCPSTPRPWRSTLRLLLAGPNSPLSAVHSFSEP